VGFNNSVFLSERETADRNFAMAYYMRENKCFPPGTNLQDSMDLYFQVRISIYIKQDCLYLCTLFMPEPPDQSPPNFAQTSPLTQGRFLTQA